MIAGALRRCHDGRLLTVGSLSGVIYSSQGRFRHKRKSLHDRPPIDMQITLSTPEGMKQIVLSPKTDIRLGYAQLPTLNFLTEEDGCPTP